MVRYLVNCYISTDEIDVSVLMVQNMYSVERCIIEILPRTAKRYGLSADNPTANLRIFFNTAK